MTPDTMRPSEVAERATSRFEKWQTFRTSQRDCTILESGVVAMRETFEDPGIRQVLHPAVGLWPMVAEVPLAPRPRLMS